MSPKNTAQIYRSMFYEYMGLNPDHQNKNEPTSVYMGYIIPIQAPSFVVHFMDWWVHKVDQQLDTLDSWSESFTLLFSQRGYTLAEFRTVMHGRIKEENYDHERVFDYLYITDRHAHDIFIASHTDDQKELTTIYLDSIKKHIESEITDLTAFFLTQKMHIYFPENSLERHAHILAKSGSGKSELIKLMFYALQKKSAKKWNKTLIAIAPEADLPTELLRFSLNEGKDMKRVVYLDPFIRQTAKNLLGEDIFDHDYIFRINPFELDVKDHRRIDVHVQQLAKAFFEIFRDDVVLSPNMKGIVKGCINTLLRIKESTIADLKDFMDDTKNGHLISHALKNPNRIIREEMRNFQDNNRVSPTKSSLNAKLYEMLIDETFSRHLLGEQTVNLEKEINKGKIIICNFTKSKMGGDASLALGKLAVAIIQSAVKHREDIPKQSRMKTYLFLDEFQNYVNPSINELMSETRKFSLSIILSHQVWMQEMSSSVAKIVSGNTALKIGGESDPYTSKELVSQLKDVTENDFENLSKFNFFIYDSFNKKGGTSTLTIPDHLVKIKPPFYMEKESLKRFFLWLVHDSGYYVKVGDIKEKGTKRNGFSQDNDDIYNPNFED